MNNEEGEKESQEAQQEPEEGIGRENQIEPTKYLVAFGAIPIDFFKQLGVTQTVISKGAAKTEGYEAVGSCYRSILDTLQRSSSVLRVKAPENVEFCAVSSFGFKGGHCVLQLLPYIEIECILPERLQELDVGMFSSLGPDAIDSSPRFKLIYDGTCFLYYRPICRAQAILCGPADSRKLLQDILAEFETVNVFPNPLREKFVFDVHPDENTVGMKVSASDDNTINISTASGISSPDKFAYFLFGLTVPFLTRFYSLSNSTTELQRIHWDIDETIENILNERSNILGTSLFRLMKRRSCVSRISQLLQDFYGSYSQWSKTSKKIETQKRELKEIVREPLSVIYDKLLSNLELEEFPIETYLEIIGLAQRDIADYRKMTNLWITIVASLLSAVIGGIVGALIIRG